MLQVSKLLAQLPVGFLHAEDASFCLHLASEKTPDANSLAGIKRWDFDKASMPVVSGIVASDGLEIRHRHLLEWLQPPRDGQPYQSSKMHQGEIKSRSINGPQFAQPGKVIWLKGDRKHFTIV